MLTRLTVPDPRICPKCSGMNWYYVLTPSRNQPVEAILTRCHLPHVVSVMVDGERVIELFDRRPEAA